MEVIVDVRTTPEKLAQRPGGRNASITIEETLPPRTRPLIARLSAIGQVPTWRRAWRTRAMRRRESAVNADITGDAAS